MPSNLNGSDKFKELRDQAEALILQRPKAGGEHPSKMIGLLHELKVHQAELEIQNQELQRAQLELSSLHREYADLYQFAPSGYMTLDSRGIITRANLAAGSLLQTESGRLLHSAFTEYVASGSEGFFQDARKKAGQTGEKQSIELPLRQETGQHHWIRMDILADREKNGAVGQWRIALADIDERKKAEDRYSKQFELLESITETSPTGIVLVDADGRISFANSAAEVILNLPKDRITERFYDEPEWKIIDLSGGPFPPEGLPFNRVMKTGGPVYDVQHGIEMADGSLIFLSINAAPLKSPSGKISGIVSSFTDITQRVQAEQTLIASEVKYRTLSNNVQGMIYQADAEWGIQVILNSEKICGYFSDDFLSGRLDWIDLVHPDERQKVFEESLHLTEKEMSITREYRIFDKEKNIHWVADYTTSVFNIDGSFKNIYGVVYDITERKKMEKSLLHHTTQLRQLSVRLRRAQEDERARIARELHDEFGQALTVVKINVGRLESELKEKGSVDSMKRMREISDVTDRLLEQVRDLALNLRPSMLDDLGLVAALNWYIRGFSRRTGVECKLQVAGQESPLDDNRRIMIYRAVQESLTNVARHSQAKSAEIVLSFGSDILKIEVKDDGKGFDVEEVFAAQHGNYPIGLLGMRESAEEFGGTFHIRSKVDEGSCVTITISIEDLK